MHENQQSMSTAPTCIVLDHESTTPSSIVRMGRVKFRTLLYKFIICPCTLGVNSSAAKGRGVHRCACEHIDPSERKEGKRVAYLVCCVCVCLLICLFVYLFIYLFVYNIYIYICVCVLLEYHKESFTWSESHLVSFIFSHKTPAKLSHTHHMSSRIAKRPAGLFDSINSHTILLLKKEIGVHDMPSDLYSGCGWERERKGKRMKEMVREKKSKRKTCKNNNKKGEYYNIWLSKLPTHSLVCLSMHTATLTNPFFPMDRYAHTHIYAHLFPLQRYYSRPKYRGRW